MPLPTSASSQLDAARAEAYLRDATVPMRLAVNAADGFPLVASHWFLYRGGAFYCVLHKGSLVARRLAADGHCGFEIGSDQPPYQGVRGQGNASLHSDGVESVLRELLARYRIKTSSRLASWLLGRVEEERLVRIVPAWVSGWDFSERMADAVD